VVPAAAGGGRDHEHRRHGRKREQRSHGAILPGSSAGESAREPPALQLL
jgi:hypothetical protein